MTTLQKSFWSFLGRSELSHHTRNKYYYRLRRFVQKYSAVSPHCVTSDMIDRYIADHGELAEASKALLLSCFHAFLAYCGVDPNPAKELGRYRETPKRIKLPREDAVKLALSTAVDLCKHGEPPDIRDGLIFALAVVSGNRRGEIRNLRLDAVLEAIEGKYGGNEPGVYRVFTTGKTGEAVLRFTDFHMPLLQSYLQVRPETDCPMLFVNLNQHDAGYGNPLSLVAIDRARRKICKYAGVDVITYQEMRRRLATVIARSEGVDVAALLLNHSPHSGDRVIRAYYYDPDKARADRAAVSAFGALV